MLRTEAVQIYQFRITRLHFARANAEIETSLANLPPPAPRLPSQLVVTTLESKFRTYDMRTQHPTAGFAYLSEKAHKSTVWLAKHLPQNRDLFMTGGGNGGFNLYKYHYPNSRVKQDKVRMICRVPRCASLVGPYRYHHPNESATQPSSRTGFLQTSAFLFGLTSSPRVCSFFCQVGWFGRFSRYVDVLGRFLRK